MPPSRISSEARRCYERAGVADDLRAEHHRKTGFMSGFEEVAAGLGPGENPSFLERAKVRSGVPRAEHKE
jgi:hypothetical protein